MSCREKPVITPNKHQLKQMDIPNYSLITSHYWCNATRRAKSQMYQKINQLRYSRQFATVVLPL